MRRIAWALAAALCAMGAMGAMGALGVAQAAEVPYKPLPKFGLSIGETFPFEGLLDPDGRPVAAERLRGRPVLINFYTRHCAPCIKEVPKLNLIMRRHPDLGVLAITPDPRAEAAAYVKQHGLSWLVAADADALLSTRLQVEAFPAFALVDAQGRLLATVMANQLGGDDGHATVEGIEAWLRAHLNRSGISARQGQ